MADDRGILFTAGPDVRCGQGFPSQNTQRPESFPAGQEPYPPQAHPGRNEENRTCPRHDPGYRLLLHSIQCPAGRQAQHHAPAVLRHSDIHIITIHHQPVHQEKQRRPVIHPCRGTRQIRTRTGERTRAGQGQENNLGIIRETINQNSLYGQKERNNIESRVSGDDDYHVCVLRTGEGHRVLPGQGGRPA